MVLIEIKTKQVKNLPAGVYVLIGQDKDRGLATLQRDGRRYEVSSHLLERVLLNNQADFVSDRAT